MGAILLACGNHGRYILPHGEVMIHEPLLGNHVSGNSSSIKSISESLLETKRKMNQILAKHTGRDRGRRWRKRPVMTTISALEESRNFGLVDEIIDFGRLLEECE